MVSVSDLRLGTFTSQGTFAVPERRAAAMALAFAAGIVACDRLGLAACVVVTILVALVALLVVRARKRATLLLILALSMCGALRYAADRSVAPDDVSHFCRRIDAIEGTVASDIGGETDARRMTFRVSRVRFADGWHSASGDVMVTAYLPGNQRLPKLDYGDRLRIAVHPYVPREPTNPGQFSWKDYLARHGIYCCASVRNRSQVIIVGRGSPYGVVRAALAAKRYVIWSIHRVHAKDVASVMSGVLLGTYAYLDDETLRDFTRTGTMHILAASGYNCLVLMLVASPLLRLLRVLPRHKSYVMMLLIAMYLLMVGPVPSMMRAAVMATLVLLAAPLKRVPDYKNLFYVAAFLVLLINPSYLFDIGFQLSFVAVFGLIAVAPVLERLVAQTPLRDLGRRPRHRLGDRFPERAATIAASWFKRELASVGIATIAVSLATAPIIAYYFNYVSLVSVPANLAVAFAVPVVFVDSLLSLITAHIPHCAHWIGALGTGATRAMLTSVDYLGSLKYSSVSVPSPGALAIVGYYVVLYAAAGFVRSKFAAR